MKYIERIIVQQLNKNFKIGFKRNQSALARLRDIFNRRFLKRNLHVLKDVSFNVFSGEILGIVGKNGCGKSTLLRILSGIYKDYEGNVKMNGKAIPIIGLGTGMQRRLTMGENIFVVGSLFGMSFREIKKKFNLIVSFSGLENYVDTKLFQFSSGMLQRLAFSIAVHSNPDILLLDEVFEVGDLDFRKKSAEKIKELAKKGGSVILVSHELWMIEKYCKRAIWLDKGKINKIGKTNEVIKEYKKCG